MLVPMILPPFVGAIGIKQIFGQYGAVNALIVSLGLRPEGWTFDWFAAGSVLGRGIIQALSLYPIIYINAAAALANIDPAMEEAAQNLGGKSPLAFFREAKEAIVTAFGTSSSNATLPVSLRVAEENLRLAPADFALRADRRRQRQPERHRPLRRRHRALPRPGLRRGSLAHPADHRRAHVHPRGRGHGRRSGRFAAAGRRAC